MPETSADILSSISFSDLDSSGFCVLHIAHRFGKFQQIPRYGNIVLIQRYYGIHSCRKVLFWTLAEDIWIQSDGAADLSTTGQRLYLDSRRNNAQSHPIVPSTPCIRYPPSLLYRTWYVLDLPIDRSSYTASICLSLHYPAAAAQAPYLLRSYALQTAMVRCLLPRRGSSRKRCPQVWRICSPLPGRSTAYLKSSMTRMKVPA